MTAPNFGLTGGLGRIYTLFRVLCTKYNETPDMPKKGTRPINNLLGLAVLALLDEGPAHPYELSTASCANGKRKKASG